MCLRVTGVDCDSLRVWLNDPEQRNRPVGIGIEGRQVSINYTGVENRGNSFIIQAIVNRVVTSAKGKIFDESQPFIRLTGELCRVEELGLPDYGYLEVAYA